MADQVYLSLWLKSYHPLNMLTAYEKLIRSFPFSNLRPGVSFVRAYAISFSEPPLFEQSFSETVTAESLLELMKPFAAPDTCFEIDAWWDLFQLEHGWKLSPARCVLLCFGPDFERDMDDHLRIEFGIDTHYLPLQDMPESLRPTQSNLRGLIRLAHELDETLKVDRRQLWLESGDSFAERLEEEAWFADTEEEEE
jgi:hypothetical protein